MAGTRPGHDDGIEFGVTSPDRRAIDPTMINLATSSFWYFSYDSSLAVGGSRSI
jgi:hypothetical protein